MRGYLSFNLPEDQEEFEDAQKGSKYKGVIDDMWNDMFRPRHKHGYSETRINEILENNKEANELMDLLEDMYREIVSQYD